MTESLKVIALISGGKDSLYSLLHCIQQGHQVVALANLHPPFSDDNGTTTQDLHEDSDLDSFMYQTVGYSLIPLYAQCLQLPLYRRAITGSAVQTSRDYAYSSLQSSSPQSDEVEDLIPLLRDVLRHHPEATAISTGAIQSTYQRTRVESIAVRLGLVPLGFLWQYIILPPPFSQSSENSARDSLTTSSRADSLTSLLDDMGASGCSSRIIKIASGGIRESLLWSDVTSPKTKTQLAAGLCQFFDGDELGLRGALVGEGGEYETLALCGPRSVWKGGRIVVDESRVQTYTGEGGASYVKIGAASVVPWDDEGGDLENSTEKTGAVGSLARIPGMFDEQFRAVQKTISTSKPTPVKEMSTLSNSTTSNFMEQNQPLQLSYSISSNTIHIMNISHLEHSEDKSQAILLSLSEQMTRIAALVRVLISNISTENAIEPALTTSSIISTTLLLRDMADFTIINPIYASIFEIGVPNPPARVTVAAPLPEGVDVTVSFVLDLGPRAERRGLHVQSRSYWAPANIGPYSQAIAVPLRTLVRSDSVEENDYNQQGSNTEIVYVAGQIPLIPSSMQIFAATFADQAVLSLQHLWRIGQERAVDQWTTGVAFISRSTATELVVDEKIAQLAEIWRQTHLAVLPDDKSLSLDDNEEDPDFDIWHQRNNRLFPPTYQQPTEKTSGQQYLHQLPNLRIPSTSPSHNNGNVTSETGRLIIPSLVIAEVSALPRDAPIEWWSTGLASLLPSVNSSASAIEHTQGTNYTRLKVTSSSSSTDFVAYFFFSPSTNTAASDESSNDTIEEDPGTKSSFSDPDLDNSTIVTGTAFVASRAFGTWRDLLSSMAAAASGSTSSISNNEAEPKERKPLADLVAYIPCYHVWGQIGELVASSSSSSTSPNNDKTGASDRGNGKPAIRECDMALILRLES